MNLEDEFIKCRDALACAVEWLEQDPEHPENHIPIPAERLQWLMDRLDAATMLADRIANATSEGK